MRLYLARHAETVYNAGARMQGHDLHTPLTRAGFAQAEAIGAALRAELGNAAELRIWSSPAGRTLQTASIVAEHLGCDFFDIEQDPRLFEIDVGDWSGRRYAEVTARFGPIHCPRRGVFNVRPPNGEWYPQIAARLESWLKDLPSRSDAIVVTHGVTLRVLRGLLVGGDPFEGVALAENANQGTLFVVEHGVERILHVGAGRRGAQTA